MKRTLFIWTIVIIALALPVALNAAPLTQRIGAATATLTLNPDPPTIGTTHAILTVSGVSSTALSTTSIAFGSSMPSMNMAGASGPAHRVASGRYAFDLPVGTATAWSVTIRATGGVTGSAAFAFSVVNPSGSAPSSEQISGAAPSAAGTRDAGPWRTAALLLLLIVIVLAFLWRRIRTPWTFVVLGVAGAAVIGVAALQTHVDALPGSMNGMDMNALSDVKGDAPITVRTVAVASTGASVSLKVYAPGTLAPYLLQDIVARSPGVLENFTTYAGDRVSSGQVLAQLSEPELAARADASRADAAAQSHSADAAAVDASSRAPANVVVSQAAAAAAKLDAEGAVADLAAKNERRRYWMAELGREGMLLKEGAVSQQEFQDERAQAATADAEATMALHRVHSSQEQYAAANAKIVDASATLQIARATSESMRAAAERSTQTARVDSVLASYTTVVAPMDGIVLKRMVDPGTYVQAGTVIARVAVIDRLRVQANISATSLSGMSVGTPITAVTGDGLTFHGRVTSVAPVVDPSTRTATVEAIVENPGRLAVPGGYVRVLLAARAHVRRGTLRVPSPAIVSGTETPAVWRVTEGSVDRVVVHVQSDDGRNAYIAGDLHPGERVVVDGALELQQGSRVSEAPL